VGSATTCASALRRGAGADFAAGARRVVTFGAERRLRVWRWQVDDLIAEACSLAGRNLSREEWRAYLEFEPYRLTCEPW